jgi:hypothetical protein
MSLLPSDYQKKASMRLHHLAIPDPTQCSRPNLHATTPLL